MTDSYADDLRELIDKQKIHDLVMRYCRAVDRLDRDGIAACFHPDGTLEFGALLLEGNDGIADAMAATIGKLYLTFHMVGNHLVDLRGDVAGSETYYYSVTTVENEDGSKVLRMRAGRYVDRIERRDGVWRIKTRIAVEDWCRFIDKPDLPEGVSFRPGLQGHADALYLMLDGLPK